MQNQDYKLSVPLLLIAFNRPDLTKIVFNRIKVVKPRTLYIAVDGPRQGIESETDLVSSVRDIVKNIDWPCKAHYRFNEDNLGAEITVSSAISWVLDREDSVIILEDDIIATVSFFRFVEEMLIRYINTDEICMVSGCNFTPLKNDTSYDYLFSKYGHIGGWGTWSRAWKKFDLNISNFKEIVNYKSLRKTCESKAETKYFLRKYKAFQKKGAGKNTWDSCWGYIYRTSGLLAIVPRKHLTSNIGVYGLHSSGQTEHHFRTFDENFRIITHPLDIKKNVAYDKHHFENYIKAQRSSLLKRLKKRLF